MIKATSRTVLVALVSGLAACSNDGAVSPRNQIATPKNVSGNGSLATLTMTDTVSFSFTVNNDTASSFFLGAGNSVKFPAGSICDPSSSYGSTEWDNACTPASAPVTVDATAWLDSLGHPRVDFSTHLRFVPSANPANWVTLSFTNLDAAQDPSTDILYCATAYVSCVSELSGDATLVTVRNPVTGLVTRRVKHFSGFAVGTGDGCPDENPGCIEGGIGFNKVGMGVKMPSVATASAVIGPMGGVLKLASAGLTVEVPAGALSKTMTLSVSTRKGALLAYEFQPHGTQFNVPLRVTQDLRGVDLKKAARLQAVYFADDSQVDDAAGNVAPSELLSVEVNKARDEASFSIKHFSGYMFASGDDDGSDGQGLNYSRILGGSSVRLMGIERATTTSTDHTMR